MGPAARGAAPRVVPLRRDPSAVTLVDPHAEAYSNPAQDQAEEIEEEARAPRRKHRTKRAKPAAEAAAKRKGGYEFPRSRCSPRQRRATA